MTKKTCKIETVWISHNYICTKIIPCDHACFCFTWVDICYVKTERRILNQYNNYDYIAFLWLLLQLYYTHVNMIYPHLCHLTVLWCYIIWVFSSPEHEVLSELLWSFNVRRPCVRASTISLNNSSATAYWILTKLYRNDPWVIPY